MKKYNFILIFLVAFSIVSCDLTETTDNGYNYIWTDYWQSNSDDRNLSDSIKSLIKLDASVLTFRIMITDSFTRDNIVELNELLSDDIYRGLICIYNARNLSPINQIFDKYHIHARENPSLSRLIILVDTTKEWTQAWRRGDRLTGNQQIDSLVLTYNLQLGSGWFFSNYHTLISPKPLNLIALKNLFKKIDGVIDAAPDGLMGDGNDIFLSKVRSNRLFTFKYGWGDCFAGCMFEHYWEIIVTPDERIRFINDYGDRLN